MPRDLWGKGHPGRQAACAKALKWQQCVTFKKRQGQGDGAEKVTRGDWRSGEMAAED